MKTATLLEAAEELAAHIRTMNSDKTEAEYRIKELEEDCRRIEHEVERPRCRYKERARLATQLAVARRERRGLKDWIRENEGYFRWMGTDGGAKTQTMIANLVGVGRKIEAEKYQRRKAAAQAERGKQDDQ